MSSSEDTVPRAYPYSWNPTCELSLQDYLTKYKPSMVQDDGTKPWLWVKKSAAPAASNDQLAQMAAATTEAKEYLEDVTEKIEKIKNDDSIPIRSNKKKGLRSKKEHREEIQNEATEKLKEISVRHGYVSGKWLIFAPSDKVDLVWSSVAVPDRRSSGCHLCGRHQGCHISAGRVTNYQHVLCLYMPNVYDKDSVLEVMKVLLRQHGVNLAGVKSNLYTSIGLDSKHASGIPSTVWKNTALMEDSKIKELKEQFYAEIAAAKDAAPKKEAEAGVSAETKTKVKPRLKRRRQDDDPFASEEDQKAKDPSVTCSSEDEDEQPKKDESKSKKVSAKTKTSASSKRAQDESSDDERPRKKRAGRK